MSGTDEQRELDRARRLVRGFTSGGTPEQVEAVAQHIVRTGDCVMHAAHVVLQTPVCHCSPCTRARGLNPLDIGAAR